MLGDQSPALEPFETAAMVRLHHLEADGDYPV
jgi:hypothetical protein